jgi:hypothetical protein
MIWINRMLRTVDGRKVRRVYRKRVDWCAEVDRVGQADHELLLR